MTIYFRLSKPAYNFHLSIKQNTSSTYHPSAHQTHDVAAGVEIETSGFARWPHIGFVWKLVAFAAIAGMTAGDQILPG